MKTYKVEFKENDLEDMGISFTAKPVFGKFIITERKDEDNSTN